MRAEQGLPATVLVLHGMGRSPRSMAPLAQDLSNAGYRVRNLGYPTRGYDVAELTARYLAPAIAACDASSPVHLVTHSLGSILTRCYLQRANLPPDSRVVMMAPPNQGSEVADHVRGWWLYRLLTGRVGQQLGTGPDSIVHSLKPVDAEIGVIAADRSLQPWFSRLFRGPNDGAVAVAKTRLPEMRDFVVVHSTHTLMMFNPKVRQQVLHFLAHGRFDHTQR